MIRLVKVERTYKAAAGVNYVVRRANLEIRQGEFVTIMGPSGAGKTTLLSILGMLDDLWRASTGSCDNRYTGSNRKKRPNSRRKHIGFVFQSYHLIDDLTVQENLDVPLSYRDIRARSGPPSWPMFWTVFRSSARRISTQPALRRPAATGGHRARRGGNPAADSCRRAHRQPAFRPVQGDHGTFPAAEPGGNHHRAGHALGDERCLWEPRHPTARWLGDERHPCLRSDRGSFLMLFPTLPGDFSGMALPW